MYFIGSDLNRESREDALATLREAGVPNAYVIDGPIAIGKPDDLAQAVAALGLHHADGKALEAGDALHTNSMLIHNRLFRGASGDLPPSLTTGSFINPKGEPIPVRELQRDLVAFMQKWAPLVRRFGWLFIELHTLDPDAVATDPDRTPQIAYDLTHGYSAQYIVEHQELLAAAALAGLVPGPASHQALFPRGDLARISITYLRGREG